MENKTNTTPSFKSHTINIEMGLYEKLLELQKRTYVKLSVTKIVNSAIDVLINGTDEHNSYASFLKEAGNDILVPHDKYASLFSLSSKNIKDKIATNTLEKVMIGDLAYIRLREDDMKNTFSQVVAIREEMDTMKEEMKIMKEEIEMMKKN